MIEKLEEPFVTNDYGCGGPSYAELIRKINELIEAHNRLENIVEKLQAL